MVDALRRIDVEPAVLSITPETIQIKLPNKMANDKFNISIQYSANLQPALFIVQYLDTKTPKARVVSSK